ncbi:Dihydrolipoyllysine-residue acetyltransferase component 4 of pyruvate dehydrogenase complex chloroplastic, partial [Bienertia sinuspersici]
LVYLKLCWNEPAPSIIPEEVVDCSAPVYSGRKGIATPYAKKLAKEHKVELGSVTGTGPFGRITPEDVEKAASIVKPKAVEGSSVIPFTAVQATVANNTMESLSVPTFLVGYPVLTNALDALYDKVKKGVTMTALLAKAIAMALIQHPVLKSTFGSLIVIKKKWKELVEKARAKQLQPQEYNSGLRYVIHMLMLSICPRTFLNVGYNATYPYDSACDQGAIMAVGASKPTILTDASGYFSLKNKMLVSFPSLQHLIIFPVIAFLEKLAQAYEVLSDPEKREIYDQYGEDALKEGMGGGSGMHDAFDIFQSFFGGSPFGGSGSSRGRRQRRGEELVHPLKVSLEDLFTEFGVKNGNSSCVFVVALEKITVKVVNMEQPMHAQLHSPRSALLLYAGLVTLLHLVLEMGVFDCGESIVIAEA